MQALRLKPSFGWRWIRGGWRLFRRQPFGFATLLFFYWIVLLTASVLIGWIAHGIGLVLPFIPVDLIAAFGSLLVATLTPALTVGFLQACRAAESGVPVHVILLFAPFRAGRPILRHLLTLGAVQVLALVLIVFATSGLDPQAPETPAVRSTPQATPQPTTPVDGAATEAGDAADEEAVRREALARVPQALAYLPVALVMWYAPMLSAWHGLPAGKALFFSIVAVWRNLGAFVVYGLGWLVIWLVLSMGIGLVASLIGAPSIVAVLALPLVMLVLTGMYCSIYPTYAMVFVEDEAVPVPDPSA